MSWTVTPSNSLPDDPDAVAYIAAVEAADAANGQSGGLETATKMAINAFVKGCKADGIWPALKASCILAGARTLSGALVPLVGVAPTNVGPFVSGDYNRKTGLVGNGTSKYLDTNRADNADPQNSIHLSVYGSSVSTGPANYYIGSGISTHIRTGNARCRDNTVDLPFTDAVGFKGIARSSNATFSLRVSATNSSITSTSSAGSSQKHHVFKRADSTGQYIDARLAFYSIGEYLPDGPTKTGLQLLDERVTALITAFGSAIP